MPLFNRFQAPPQSIEELLRNPQDFGGTPPFVAPGSIPGAAPSSLPPAILTASGGGGKTRIPISAATPSPSDPTNSGPLSPVNLILSKLGGVGRALQPVADFGGQFAEAGRNAARSGALSGLAPDFTRGVLLGDQNRRADDAADLNRQVVEAELQQLGVGGGKQGRFGKIDPSDFTVDSLERFQRSQDFGDLVFRDESSADPAVVAAFKFRQGLPPEQRPLFDQVQRAQTFTNVPGAGTLDNRGRQIVSEQDTQQALGERVTTETQARDDVGKTPELQAAIAKDQSFIDQAEGFIDQLKTGTLDTGPILGLGVPLAPQSQLFDAFSKGRVLDLISEATFGALSEGEREFLTGVDFGRSKDEKVNIDLLNRAVNIVKGAQQRSQGEIERIQGDTTEVVDFSSLPDN